VRFVGGLSVSALAIDERGKDRIEGVGSYLSRLVNNKPYRHLLRGRARKDLLFQHNQQILRYSLHRILLLLSIFLLTCIALDSFLFLPFC